MSEMRSSAAEKRAKVMGLSIAAGGVVALLFIVSRFFVGGSPEHPAEPSADTKKMLEALRSVTPQEIRGLARPTPRSAPENAGTATSETSDQPSGERPRIASSRSLNYLKDKEIIEQYRAINPAAAADDGSAAPAGESALRYRPRPFSAGAEQKEVQGGVRVVGRETGGQKKTMDLHDVSLKARLKFSIRSSASNAIVAETTHEVAGIPAGSLLYGTGSFANKRTYVQFHKIRVGDREYEIKGYAVSGRDPGIPSEVIEIENNAKITFASGVTDAAGRVLDNLAATATGGATSGVISGTAGELREKNEQERARYEYRVGAGTMFTVYVE